MKSKVQRFESEQRNVVYQVQVREDGSWKAFVQVGKEYDYANPVTQIGRLPKDIRESVKLYVAKCICDFAADKVS